MKSIAGLITIYAILLINVRQASGQDLYEQAYKLEQVMEMIDRYYVDNVNREELVNNAISDMIIELETDSALTSKNEIDRLNEFLNGYDNSVKLQQALFWISSNITDTLNKEKLVGNTIANLLYNLDPHSSYLTREEVEKMNEPLQGNFEGIGISFNILTDTIYIISPSESGPSARVGILAGDRIIKVDGENVAGIGITNDKVFELLRGEKGTRVNVAVLRRGMNSLIEFEIIRDKIPIYSIDASYKVNDNTGYIKINRFSLTTMDEFTEALKLFRNDGIQNLIIDLTGNGGGYLDVAINLADEFLEENKLILYTEGVHNLRKEYVATRNGGFENGRLVILIDEGSASASEILSGAIQDWDKGIIVGRRSYGKGLVQRPLKLIDQSMIRLTVARYYTPTGRLIQKPYNADRESYERDLQTRFFNGEFTHPDSIHFPDSLKYFTLQNTRVVYGGGGIMPDLFVAIDTSYYSGYYRQIIRKGLLNQFVLEYVDENRNSLLNKYPEFSKFKREFKIDDKLFERFTGFTTALGIKPDEKELLTSSAQISLLIKAYIARDLWTGSEFYEITNEEEPDFKMALKILSNWNDYDAMLVNGN